MVLLYDKKMMEKNRYGAVRSISSIVHALKERCALLGRSRKIGGK